MDRVLVDPSASGLGEMLAGLVMGNLDRDPARLRYMPGRGEVNITATDADSSCGLRFSSGILTVGAPLAGPDLHISTSSEHLMGLTSVPLRLGLPDAFTRDGRRVMALMAKRELRVRGLVPHVRLLSRLNRLLSVS